MPGIRLIGSAPWRRYIGADFEIRQGVSRADQDNDGGQQRPDRNCSQDEAEKETRSQARVKTYAIVRTQNATVENPTIVFPVCCNVTALSTTSQNTYKGFFAAAYC